MQAHSVRQYFRGKSVLLTGATGFFGQFIVFKLIKFCEIATLFIVLRPKNNESVERRLAELLKSDVFKSVDYKVMRDKIIAIKGDVTEEGFGFTAGVYERIKDCVLFIHSAASIRLNATLAESLLSNTNATRNALQVCRQLPKLEKFVHVSTTYVFDGSVLEEKVHNFPLSAMEINEVLDCYLNNNELDAALKKKLESQCSMNNYCLSKTLSEILVAGESEQMETLIFRPSVVLPSTKEPFSGWFSGAQIIANFAIYISSGLWRVSNLNPQQTMAVIPVDICGNALLRAISRQSPAAVTQQRLSVINAVTHNISFNYICERFQTLSKSHPSLYSIRPVVSNFDPIDNQAYFAYKRRFTETFFAVCVDFVFKCFGLRQTLEKKVRQMHEFFDALKQCSHYCEFKNDKLRDLWNGCCDDDRQLFNFNPFSIRIDVIFVTFYLRLRKQMNGGKEVNHKEAQKRQFRVNLVHYSMITVPLLLLLFLIWSFL